MYLFIYLSIYLFIYIGRGINVRSEEEKEIILLDIKKIKRNTGDEKIAVLDERILKNKIFCFLPMNDATGMNSEVAKAVLEVLCDVACDLFSIDYTKEEKKQFGLRFDECDGYNILLFFVNIYKRKELKELISIILGRFYHSIEIPSEGMIIIDILINCLKENKKNNFKETSINKYIKKVLLGLINISHNEKNKKLLLDKGITFFLFDFINTSKKNVYENAIILLSNVCGIPSVEEKNKIISSGVFIVLHKKLLEISPPPPGKILSNNYYLVYGIIVSIRKLLSSNSSGVSSLLNTPLIPVLLSTLDSSITLAITSSNENIYNIQDWICNCFVIISTHSYNNVCQLVELKVIDYMINIIEKYISQIKENKKIMKEETAENGIIVISNTTHFGFKEGSSSENNKLKKLFEEGNKLNKLIDSFNFLNSLQSLSPLQKEMLNDISISICFLFKNEKPPPSFDNILSFINKLRSSPGHLFPKAAQNAWNAIIKD
jgi:hypothetical protein